MDLSKALAMMGFGTARVDQEKRSALDELNTALIRQMENFDKKKKKIQDTEKVAQRRETQQDKIRDEIRTMHEAYQFLAKKYSHDKDRMNDKKSLKSSEIVGKEIEENEEDGHADEVFSMDTLTAGKSAANIFKGANGCKRETEDNVSVPAVLEQPVNNTQNIA
jgi:hypothetical protein